jgi:hypothetical protein
VQTEGPPPTVYDLPPTGSLEMGYGSAKVDVTDSMRHSGFGRSFLDRSFLPRAPDSSWGWLATLVITNTPQLAYESLPSLSNKI